MSVQRERTFLMIKPDAVQRGLVGEIICRFEKRGFKLIAMKFVQILQTDVGSSTTFCPTYGAKHNSIVKASRDLFEAHYEEHKGLHFYEDLIGFMASGPVIPMVWEGKGVVKTARKMMGQTNPSQSNPGTLRGDYGQDVGRRGMDSEIESVRPARERRHGNVIHGSDTVETANREIDLWFTPAELSYWEQSMDKWIYE